MKISRKIMVLVLCLVVALSVIPVQQKNVFAASKVSISKTTATIWVKNYVNLKITGTSSTIEWKSSNTKVATVSNSGKVTGVAKGRAIITATINKKDYKCTVTVKKESSIKPLEELVKDIKKNSNTDKVCKMLSDEFDIEYGSINGYQMIDCNNDGVKELVVQVWGGVYTYVFAVKDGKAVIAGKIELDSSVSILELRMYVNKKTNSIVVILTGGPFDAEDGYSYYINNIKSYERTSYHLLKRYGNLYTSTPKWEYFLGDDSDLKDITKKEYDALHNKNYNSKDLKEIEFEAIVH